MNRRDVYAAAGTAAAIGLVCALFFTCFERASIEVAVGESREARTDPFLAAERLLEAMGHTVVAVASPAALDPMPPTDATLVFTVPRRTFNPERQRALTAWVESGGHLVVGRPAPFGADEDPLLDPLGVRDRTVFPDDGCCDDEEQGLPFAAPDETTCPPPSDDEQTPEALAGLGSEGETPGEGAEAPDAETVYEDEDYEADVAPTYGVAEFADGTAPLWVRVDPLEVWERSPDAVSAGVEPLLRVSSEAGDHLLSLPLGDGILSVTSSDAFLRNDLLGDAEHAEVLVRLLRLRDREGPIWIVTSERWPGLWSQLHAHAQPVLWSGASLLIAWLWWAARRRGPVHPTPPPERRRWMEHLEAVGRYQWRRDGARTLFRANRDEALRRLQRARPGWSALPTGARDAHVADALGVDEARVRVALGATAPDGEARFVDAMRILESIHRVR